MTIIIVLFSIVFFPFLIVLLLCMYSACAISSNLSRQEELEEIQRKFKDCNKQ